MTKVMSWIGDTFSGFCAGFLVWLVAGSLIGHGLAYRSTVSDAYERRDCWPVRDAGIFIYCESEAAEALWTRLVAMPSTLVGGFATMGLVANECLFGQMCWHNAFTLTTGGIFVSMILAGFLAWRTRSALVAWTLILTLIGQIAAIILWPSIH